MKTKTIRAEVKAVETDNPNGEFEVILSAPTLDRDGEVVDSKAFDPLPDHITFDIDHGLSTASTVGSGQPFYDDAGLLRVKGTFSSIPRAQEVRTLVAEGHIRTTSVAYRGAKTETKDGVPHITKAELLNGAFVPVPANREAVVVNVKAAKVGSRNSGTDQERLQQIHDLAVDNGAACTTKRASAGVVVKTMVGSYEERQEEMTEALAALYPDSWWVEVIGMFDDHVIYEVHGGGFDDSQFTLTYTWDGDDVILGSAVPVEVNEVATPVPAGDVEKSVSSREDATGAGGDDEQQHLELRARALQLIARTTI